MPKNLGGHVTLATPPFRKFLNFKAHVWTVPVNMPVKFDVRSSSELLAFNAQKFRGSRDPGHAPFWKKF